MSRLAQNVSKAIAKKRSSGDGVVVDSGDGFEIGPFKLHRTGLEVSGDPSFEEWEGCGNVLRRIEGAVQFWIGDWVNYGDSRKWGEKYTKALEATGYDEGTLRNCAFVAGNIQVSRRRDNVSFSVHQEVAALPTAKDQDRWLARAAEEGLTRSALRTGIRSERHQTKVAAIASGEIPEGEYDVVCADPPWQYDNSGFQQSAAGHYPTMADEEICALPQTDATFPKTADPCVLFLWATSPRLPSAHAVMAAWGFEYKACMVWVKDRAPGLGWWLQTRHELLLIGARGSSTPQEKIDSVFEASVGEHSRKPDEAYAAIERMFPGLRRVEIFARTAREGWDVWGNEV